MPLKKLLSNTPNFHIQANTSRLPTSYQAHLFARAENEQRGKFFYVNRGDLIIILVLQVGVKHILIIYSLQVTIFDWSFSYYPWIKTAFDVKN